MSNSFNFKFQDDSDDSDDFVSTNGSLFLIKMVVVQVTPVGGHVVVHQIAFKPIGSLTPILDVPSFGQLLVPQKLRVLHFLKHGFFDGIV